MVLMSNTPKIVAFIPFPDNHILPLFKDKTIPINYNSIKNFSEVSEEQVCELVKDATIIVSMLNPDITSKVLESAEKTSNDPMCWRRLQSNRPRNRK